MSLGRQFTAMLLLFTLVCVSTSKIGAQTKADHEYGIHTGSIAANETRFLKKYEFNRDILNAYRHYTYALNELASANMMGPYEAVEPAKAEALADRAELIKLAGAEDVSDIDSMRRDLFVNEYRKNKPELSSLCDAFVKNCTYLNDVTERLKSSTPVPNRLLLVLSHSEPFGWECPVPGTTCAGPLPMILWLNSDPKIVMLQADYLRPPLLLTKDPMYKRLFWLRSRDEARELESSYRKYLASIAVFSTSVGRSAIHQDDVAARGNALAVESNRKHLVIQCGEESIRQLDNNHNFEYLLKQCSEFTK